MLKHDMHFECAAKGCARLRSGLAVCSTECHKRAQAHADEAAEREEVLQRHHHLFTLRNERGWLVISLAVALFGALFACLIVAIITRPEPEFIQECTQPVSYWAVVPQPMGTAMGGMPIGGMALVLMHDCAAYATIPNPRFK